MSSSYSVSWQLKGTVMKTMEHNRRLATLQQELDKFNEDRQGNKDKGKREEKLPQTVGQTNEERRRAQRFTDGFQISYKCEQDQSLML